jgi:ATP-binding protein involved in chromosome partitioning
MQGSAARVSIPGVSKVITVCSAKGGVGKSTSSVNIALALKNLGHNVGLVDADVTGPSIPTMMQVDSSGVETYRHMGIERFQPPSNYGIKVMSMGLVVSPDEAIAIRGPMINKYIRALLFQTDWGDLDYLVIDMPPGTHDVHITITQEVALTGAVIVSTPQHVALIDVRRGLDMFAAVNVPILGLVENMSYFQCHKCSEKHYLFGAGKVEDTAKELNIPFLGEVPFIPKIQQETDAGMPPALRGDETIPAAAPYYSIARKTLEEIKKHAAAKKANKAPKIVFDE